MKKDLLVKIMLGLILLLALFLRVYKLDQVPPSISWDEAAVGYNAYTIANFGRDENGKILPLFFKSFGDDKHPVHIYLTAISVKILGLSEFSVRLPSALFGVLNVLLIFFLAKFMFESDYLGLFAAFTLAISPYNIHFSRFNHEANFALFFFMLGLVLFYQSLKKSFFLPFSILSFAITFITYHPAKIIVPIVIISLSILYAKKLLISKTFLLINKKSIFSSIAVILLLILILVLNPQLLGIARINQTSHTSKDIEKTRLFQLTKNQLMGQIEITVTQYTWHFLPQYLFIQGDKNPRLSSQTGEFYKIDTIFLILGVVYLLYKRSRAGMVLLTWALIAPIPSALVAEAPHAARSMYIMGSWHLISASGFYFLLTLFKKPLIKWVIVIVTFTLLIFSLKSYVNYYYGEYTKRYAIDWQYGMKQIVEYVKGHFEYEEVFMTDVRSQPYIFFLFYLKTPLPDYLNSIVYNNNIENKSYNTVSVFDRYYFGGWDPVESFPNDNVLYVVTPSQYDGLRHKALFDVKKLIYYPNGLVAYYLVSKKI